MRKKDGYEYEDLFKEEKKGFNMLPIMALVFIVPLIVRLSVIALEEQLYRYWNGETITAEMFSYVKMEVTIILTIFLSLVLVMKYINVSFKVTAERSYIKYILIYTIFVALSFVFSDFKIIAKEGFVGKNEGVWTLISYMIILLASIKLVEKEYHAKLVMWSISLGGLFLGIVGLTQISKQDFWKSSLGQALIIPNNYKEILSSGLDVTMKEGTAYGTLNNTNYMGSYTVLIIPIIIALIIITKNKLAKLFLASIAIIMVANLFGSNSRAGIVGVALAIGAFMVIIGIKLFSKHKLLLLSIITIFLVVAVGSYKIILENRNPVKRIIAGLNTSPVATQELKDVIVSGNTVKIITKDRILEFTSNNGEIVFRNEDGEELYRDIMKDGRIRVCSKKYVYCFFSEFKDRNNETILVVRMPTKINLNFNIQKEDEIFLCDNKGYKLPDIEAKSIGFKGLETLGSGRAYIWSRTLPLLKNTIVLGYGPDCYVAAFPQYDLKGKIVGLGNSDIIVDKPHNFYLEVAVNTGLISLMALLLMFATYLISCLKIFRKLDLKNNYHIIAMGIFTSVVGYLGTLMFNDSIIAVAVVFWVVLGLGIAVNYIINKEAKKETVKEAIEQEV